MSGVLHYLEKNALVWLETGNLAYRFLAEVLSGIQYVWRRPAIVWRQLSEMAERTLSFIVVAGFLVGVVLWLRAPDYLTNIQSPQGLGRFVLDALTHDIAPFMSAVFFAGRVGASLTSELGIMRTTDQFHALEMMAVEPLSHIVLPRMLASLIMLPLFFVLFVALGLVGAYVADVAISSDGVANFWLSIYVEPMVFFGLLVGLVKSGVFAFAIAWISLYLGYFTMPDADAIANASSRSVILSAVAVLIIEFIFSAIIKIG